MSCTYIVVSVVCGIRKGVHICSVKKTLHPKIADWSFNNQLKLQGTCDLQGVMHDIVTKGVNWCAKQ